MDDKRRVKIARCKDCGGAVIASALPYGDEDRETLSEFRKASMAGHRIEYVDLEVWKASGELCSCRSLQMELIPDA